MDLDNLRIEAVRELDVEKMKQYIKSIGISPASSDEIVLAGLHKARLAMPGFTAAQRDQSVRWLTANDFSPSIDPVEAMKSLKGWLSQETA